MNEKNRQILKGQLYIFDLSALNQVKRRKQYTHKVPQKTKGIKIQLSLEKFNVNERKRAASVTIFIMQK